MTSFVIIINRCYFFNNFRISQSATAITRNSWRLSLLSEFCSRFSAELYCASISVSFVQDEQLEHLGGIDVRNRCPHDEETWYRERRFWSSITLAVFQIIPAEAGPRPTINSSRCLDVPLSPTSQNLPTSISSIAKSEAFMNAVIICPRIHLRLP